MSSLSVEHFWDDMYRDLTAPVAFGASASSEVVQVAKLLPSEACGIDIGCGDGRNALFLAERGCKMTAIDISPVGIVKVRQFGPNVDWKSRQPCRTSAITRSVLTITSWFPWARYTWSNVNIGVPSSQASRGTYVPWRLQRDRRFQRSPPRTGRPEGLLYRVVSRRRVVRVLCGVGDYCTAKYPVS